MCIDFISNTFFLFWKLYSLLTKIYICILFIYFYISNFFKKNKKSVKKIVIIMKIYTMIIYINKSFFLFYGILFKAYNVESGEFVFLTK